MPLAKPPHVFIEQAVGDRRSGDTLFRQKATFLTLSHTQAANGECSAHITVQVRIYGAEGDGFGPELVGPGFSSYTVTLVADNQTLVDPGQNGAILAIRQGENEAEWQAIIDSFPQDTMLQGDFFEYLREQQPILIGAMIRQHIAAADAMGRFNA